MYRVELKAVFRRLPPFVYGMFLMYRVELKVISFVGMFTLFMSASVPNVPCGVESYGFYCGPGGRPVYVPNVPCGVESLPP